VIDQHPAIQPTLADGVFHPLRGRGNRLENGSQDEVLTDLPTLGFRYAHSAMKRREKRLPFGFCEFSPVVPPQRCGRLPATEADPSAAAEATH
jgi:hypothetical protein